MTVKLNQNCSMVSDTVSAEKVLLVREEEGVVRVYHLPGHGMCMSVGTWTPLAGLKCDIEDMSHETQQAIALHAVALYNEKAK